MNCMAPVNSELKWYISMNIFISTGGKKIWFVLWSYLECTYSGLLIKGRSKVLPSTETGDIY